MAANKYFSFFLYELNTFELIFLIGSLLEFPLSNWFSSEKVLFKVLVGIKLFILTLNLVSESMDVISPDFKLLVDRSVNSILYPTTKSWFSKKSTV